MSLQPGSWRAKSSRRCKCCQNVFVPRKDESLTAWERRQFCGPRCSGRFTLQRLKAERVKVVCKPRKYVRTGVTKPCLHCGQGFAPAGSVDSIMWIRAKFCGRPCSNAHWKAEQKLRLSDEHIANVGGVIPPEDARTPQERLRWLRLSYSTCGRKVPWSRTQLAQRAKILTRSVESCEMGELTQSNNSVMLAICEALGLKTQDQLRLLTVSQSKFVSVVKAAGLIAKPIRS